MELKDIINKLMKVSVLDLDHSNYTISTRQRRELEDALMKGIPFSYILNQAEFYNHKFFINQHVLIPRQETEFLVDLIVQEKKGKVENILDVGTGSGVILLSLLSSGVGKKGTGIDISGDALDVARTNSINLGLSEKVEFLLSDRLKNAEGIFDLIVSNPPYIKSGAHRALVHPKVDLFEPHKALYLSDESYDFWFESFFKEVRSHLCGTFYMEGHEQELEKQSDKLKELGFHNVAIIQDLSGMPRFLKADFNINEARQFLT